MEPSSSDRRLSPMAHAVLNDHRAAPDDLFFDLAIFGSMWRSQDMDRLQEAYNELERTGMVERSGEFEEFFGRILPLYRLAPAGRAEARLAS